MDKRTTHLVSVAEKTLERGDRELAKEMMVLAFRQEDAIEALDKLLPRVPDPLPDSTFDLDEYQVAKVQKIVSALSSVEPEVAENLLRRLELTIR